MSADIWDALWSVRHAHVVDGRECCDCEDSSQPGRYLLAWGTEHEVLFRELSSEEARRLQQLCLESQAEQARDAIERAADAPLQSQLGLF